MPWIEAHHDEVRLMDLIEGSPRGRWAADDVEEAPYPVIEYLDVVVANHPRTHDDERDAVRAALRTWQRDGEILPAVWFRYSVEDSPPTWQTTPAKDPTAVTARLDMHVETNPLNLESRTRDLYRRHRDTAAQQTRRMRL